MYKILYIINNLKGGGAEQVITTLASMLNPLEFQPYIFSLDDEIMVKVPDRIQVIKANFSHITQAKKIMSIHRKISKIKPHLVHSNLLLADWVSGIYKIRNKQVPVISTIHGYNREENKNLRLKNKLHFQAQQYLYHKLDKLIAVSEDLRKNIMRSFNLNAHQVTMIYNGIQSAEKLPTYRQKKNKQKRLLYIGSLRSVKNVQALIYTMEQLPEYFKLTVIGAGPLEQELKNLVNEKKLTDRIHFAGYQKDTSGFILNHDILIIPSYYETFSMVALQGLLTGIPTLASESGGIKEVFGYNLRELLFDPKDVAGIKEKILWLEHNYENVLKKISLEKKRLLSFSATNMCNQYTQLYKSILEKI